MIITIFDLSTIITISDLVFFGDLHGILGYNLYRKRLMALQAFMATFTEAFAETSVETLLVLFAFRVYSEEQ